MSTESASIKPEQHADDDKGRGRSTIEFPYLDLASAVEVVQHVRNVGGTGCDWKQLAVKMGLAPEGGGFRMRVMTAKTFGLLSYGSGQIQLTDLGIESVEPGREKKAKLDAFMKVPLYKALFDKLNGQTLPPAAAVERMIEQLGVAPKQKDKARQAFMRSAKQAALFEISQDRMSIPPGIGFAQKDSGNGQPRDDAGRNSGGGNGGGIGLDLDPLLIALLQKIPAQGEQWPAEKRLRWFKTFAMNVSQVYDDDDHPVEITIAITGKTET